MKKKKKIFFCFCFMSVQRADPFVRKRNKRFCQTKVFITNYDSTKRYDKICCNYNKHVLLYIDKLYTTTTRLSYLHQAEM